MGAVPDLNLLQEKKPIYLSCSSFSFPSEPFSIFVSLLCMHSNSFRSFWYCGAQNCPQSGEGQCPPWPGCSLSVYLLLCLCSKRTWIFQVWFISWCLSLLKVFFLSTRSCTVVISKEKQFCGGSGLLLCLWGTCSWPCWPSRPQGNLDFSFMSSIKAYSKQAGSSWLWEVKAFDLCKAVVIFTQPNGQDWTSLWSLKSPGLQLVITNCLDQARESSSEFRPLACLWGEAHFK